METRSVRRRLIVPDVCTQIKKKLTRRGWTTRVHEACTGLSRICHRQTSGLCGLGAYQADRRTARNPRELHAVSTPSTVDPQHKNGLRSCKRSPSVRRCRSLVCLSNRRAHATIGEALAIDTSIRTIVLDLELFRFDQTGGGSGGVHQPDPGTSLCVRPPTRRC